MKQSVFTLTENEALTSRFSLLRLRGDCSAIEGPGQFVTLSLPGFFLRRPFSVCDWDEHGFSLIVEARALIFPNPEKLPCSSAAAAASRPCWVWPNAF